MAPIINEALETLFDHPNNHKGPNIHMQLLLSFGLVFVNSIIRYFIFILIIDRHINIKDIAHTLIYKILNIPIFSNIDLLVPKFKPTWIFELVDKMLKSKVLILSLQVVQAIIKPSIEEKFNKM